MTTQIERRNRRYGKMTDDLVIVQQGVMYAEMNEFFMKHLKTEGYAGMEYKPYTSPVEVTLKLARTGNVLGNNKLRLKQMIALLEMRFDLPEGSLAIYLEQVRNRALCAQIQADVIREKLAAAIPVRRAASAALRTIIEGGAAGAQIIVSGKIRGQRAKSYKVSSGNLLHSGAATKDYVRKAQSSILLKQGVLGIKVAITLKYDPTGQNGTDVLHPTQISIFSPEELEERRVKANPNPKKQALRA